MAEELKKRVIRVILNSALLVALAIALDITIPTVLTVVSLIPKEGLSLSTALTLLLIIVMAFQALRIILDLVRLVDLVTDFMVKHVPGLEVERKVSVVRALKEVIIVIILILLTTALYPIFLLVPEFGPWLSIGASIISIALSVALIYDAGKTLYAVFQSGLEFFIEKLMEVPKPER